MSQETGNETGETEDEMSVHHRVRAHLFTHMLSYSGRKSEYPEETLQIRGGGLGGGGCFVII